jgi:hypothetical protein
MLVTLPVRAAFRAPHLALPIKAIMLIVKS